MTEIVSASAPSGGITWADHKGALLIIKPEGYEEGINTSFGLASAVKADVYVLTGPDTAEEFPSALVFPKLLASQLKNQIGNTVVGRLNQGQAKPGQSAPWLLDQATADDIEKAKSYLDKSATPAVTTAAAPF